MSLYFKAAPLYPSVTILQLTNNPIEIETYGTSTEGLTPFYSE